MTYTIVPTITGACEQTCRAVTVGGGVRGGEGEEGVGGRGAEKGKGVAGVGGREGPGRR